MMDESSTGNLISRNQVNANHGYGIVLSHSSANVVRNNVVEHNLVGIEVNGGSAGAAVVRSNSIVANEVATQGLARPTGSLNSIVGLPSQWRTWLIVPLWSLFVLLVAVNTIMSVLERRQRVHPPRPGPKVLAA
jgi:parallel beta-helix repeat protein